VNHKDKWKNHISSIIEVEGRAMAVDELADRLLDIMPKSSPSARKITSNLKLDKRFTAFCRTTTGSLMRNKSHKVWVFGLSGLSYSEAPPFTRKDV